MSLHISDGVIWQEAADGVSLYQMETGRFLSLNGTGAKIWSLVASDGERTPVAWKIALEFGGTNAALGRRIRTEVDEFITSMVGTGLLIETAPA